MDQAIVEAVLEDWQTAPIDTRLSLALGFLEKLNNTPDDVTNADILELERQGLGRDAIAEAAYVCFMFNIMDRLADAFDFQLPEGGQQKRIGMMLYKGGYGAASLRG